jgi:hypothetical protein
MRWWAIEISSVMKKNVAGISFYVSCGEVES